jgi:hemolysin activation/secretion protein
MRVLPARPLPSRQHPHLLPPLRPWRRRPPRPCSPIRGFRVEGDNPIGEAQAQRVLAPFVLPVATLQTLQQATAALETALREQGYGLHRVALPPQEVGSTVRLTIVKFVVGKVAIEGASIYDEGNIRRSLPQLREGESPNFKTLAIQTAITNENPNKQVQVGLRESEEPDRIDANITVKEQRPWTFGATLSNAGSSATGHDRFTIAGGHTNVFNRDHQFVGAYTTALSRPSDVKQLGLAYKVPLYAAGGVIGASYTRSDVVGNFGTFNSTGAGHTFGLNYTMYLPPQGGRRSYVTLGLDDRLFNASKINDIVVPGALDRRSRPISIGYATRTETDTATWGYGGDLSINTGGGAHNDLASYQSEDPRINNVHFMVLRAIASYTAPLQTSWLWTARGSFQYSPDVLISGEQFGLGGIGSVRGTEIERPISGDKGLAGSLELMTPELASGLRALGFVDAGYLRNNQPNGTTKPSSDRLASLGVGLRYSVGVFSLTADYGRLVLGSRVSPLFNSAAPRRGEDRFYVTLAARF